jgi:signal transduction histidine kinase
MQRYALALVAGVCAVLAAYAVAQGRSQRRSMLEALHASHHELGAALAEAVAAVWRIDGEARALAFVDGLAKSDATIRVRWVWLDDIASPLYRPSAPIDIVRQALDSHGELQWRATDDDLLLTYVPVSVTSPLPGALELSQSLAPVNQLLRQSYWVTAGAAVIIVVFAGLLALLLGLLLVGQPVRELLRFAQRLGAGGFGEQLKVQRRDELGVLTEAMNTMSTQLQAAVEARLTAIEKLRHADRLATVGKLAAGLAHELGTPLNTVSLQAQLIDGSEEALGRAKAIREQCQRMSHIVRQLLDFSRPRPAEASALDLREVVQRGVTLLEPLAKQARVELRVETAEGPPPLILGDAMQLEQVITNLTVNAIQASPAGSVVVHRLGRSLTRAPGEGQTADFVRLDVVDHGSGIAQEHLPHLFDPFFTTKDVGVGTGLGLAVVHGIVREHHGWIDVHSKPTQGSVFSIYLPARPS